MVNRSDEGVSGSCFFLVLARVPLQDSSCVAGDVHRRWGVRRARRETCSVLICKSYSTTRIAQISDRLRIYEGEIVRQRGR